MLTVAIDNDDDAKAGLRRVREEIAQGGALTYVGVVNEHVRASQASDLGGLVGGPVIKHDDLVRVPGDAQHEAAYRYLFVVARNANHDRQGGCAVSHRVEFRHIHWVLLGGGQCYSACYAYRVLTRHKVCCLLVNTSI